MTPMDDCCSGQTARVCQTGTTVGVRVTGNPFRVGSATIRSLPQRTGSVPRVFVTYPESLDHMLAAWNEPDPALVRHHVERAVAPGVEFVDPSVATHGIDEFETNVHRVQRSLPGAIYSRTSGVDSHHQLHRYSWQISRGGIALLSPSTSPRSTSTARSRGF